MSGPYPRIGVHLCLATLSPLLKARGRQVGNAPAEAAGKARLSNVQVDTQRATVHGPFRIGDLRLTDVEVRISERYPELLVGAHALQDAVVVIDQRSKAVAICR
jgi:hypothetical protein